MRFHETVFLGGWFVRKKRRVVDLSCVLEGTGEWVYVHVDHFLRCLRGVFL